MDTKDLTPLEQALEKSCKNDAQMDNDGYFASYIAAKKYLNKNIHPSVQPWSVINDPDTGYLTDHGPEHIRTVMLRAGGLLNNDFSQFNPMELFILCFAIHLHDVGNMYGRHEHEKNVKPIYEAIKPANISPPIWKAIYSVASAHGGYTKDGKKDTVGQLQDTDLYGHSTKNRCLAALLRFADELADDHTRTTKFSIDQKMLPKGSQVYHKYAEALHTVSIDQSSGTIKLTFSINKPDYLITFGKGKDDIFLLDEIYIRTFKVFKECRYAMLFLKKMMDYQTVRVCIDTHNNDDLHYSADAIVFELSEAGYPIWSQISDVCTAPLISGMQYKSQLEGVK